MNKRFRRKAVTLIELVMVIVITGILALTLSQFIIQTVNTWRFVDFRREVAEEGKKALTWVSRDMRKIRDSSGLSFADSGGIRFWDSDGNTVEYLFSGNVLSRNDYELCDSIETFSLDYRDKNNNILAPLPLSTGRRKKIRSIIITIGLEDSGQRIEFSSTVYPRNLNLPEG